MMGNKKLQVWLPLVFSVVLIAGMFLGYRLNSKPGSKKGFFSSNKRGSLQEVLDIIRMRYVDSVKLDTLEDKAIQEMMNELDPHSVYLPPVQLKEANEDLAGHFDGIGVEFNVFNDTVNVVYVIPQGPSDKAGLQIGDKLLKVNDSLLAGRPLGTEEIKKLIRGEKGSAAILTILRGKQQKNITVTRGNIPVSSIDAAYMADKTTAYIRLNKFSENSYEEFMAAMETLQKEGMQNLVFDLRGNGGGFMNEAVEMADEFLDGDKLIVYTQGINSKKKEFRSRRPGLFEKGKLVVLVDELSASASEVLAGALQDWCRAKIVGRRTFGKGLVQEQYELSDGAAIRLTVARYYTPLGRSIQRSYGQGKKVYMDELWERYSSGELLSADSIKSHNGKIFQSLCKDSLYAGDGITPHIFVPIDTSYSQQRVLRLIGNGMLGSFVYNYYLSHKQELEKFRNAGDYSAGYNSTEMMNSLLNSTHDSFRLKSITPAEKQALEKRLKALLARYKWRNSGFYQVLNQEDGMVKKAMEIIAN